MYGRSWFLAAPAVAIAALWCGVVPLAGQARQTPPKAATKNWVPPRTPDGRPDLQGIWNFSSLTPLERPGQFAGKDVLTEEELAEFEKQAVERNDADRRTPGTAADVNLAYNNFWYDRGAKSTNRTSLVVDPPDGRVPALTAEGQRRAAARAEARRQHGPADSPEDRSLAERCLLFGAGPPMMPGPYNNNVQVVQSRDQVVIHTEMIHDARIVPLDGRPHLSARVRLWMGDSRGHWEGDTLVVDTTNFSDRTNVRGSDENLHLIERFTLVDADTLIYRYTVDDSTVFTRPWTVEIPLARTEDHIYEYACHEANYGMTGILKGARADEAAAGK